VAYFLIITAVLLPIVVPIPGILYRRARRRSGELFVREAWPEIRKYYQLFGLGLGLSLLSAIAIYVWRESEGALDFFTRLFGVGTIALVSVVYLSPLWIRALRRTERHVRVEWLNRCRHCDYDLTDNLTGICSECGELRDQFEMPIWLDIDDEDVEGKADEKKADLSLTWFQRTFSSSREKFAQMVTREVRKQHPECTVTSDAARFVLVVESDEKRTEHELELAYYMFASSQLFARTIVAAEAGAIGAAIVEGRALPERFDDARSGLIPKCVPGMRVDLKNVELMLDGEPPVSYPSREFGERFEIWLRYESEMCSGFVEEADLRRWGVSLDKALSVARDNLRELCKEPFKEIAPGVHESPGGSHYDATRIMLTDQIRELPVDGTHVALIVDKYELLVTGSNSIIGMVEFAKKLKSLDDYSFYYEGGPLILEGDSWRIYEPPGRHPAAIALRNLNTLRRAEAYQSQAEELEKLFAQEAANTVVAEAKTETDDVTGERTLIADWPDGELVSLPEVDRVRFESGSGAGLAQTVTLDWDEIRRWFSDLMVTQDLNPPRWLLRRADVENRLPTVLQP
jgi:hypothetical protein